MIRFYSLEDFRRAHEDAGKHWFSPGSMRFFKSRILWDTYDAESGLFVSSEQFDANTPRKYTLRHADQETLAIKTVGEFQAYETRGVATRALSKHKKGAA